MSRLPLKEAPRKICILRLSALGDVTHVLPVIHALRSQWPEAQITWVIGKLEHRLMHGLPGVTLAPFDKRAGLSELLRFRRTFADHRFDVLLHMQVAARANILSRFIDAPIRLGWDRARSRDGHRWFVTDHVAAHSFQHQVDGFLEFATALGVPRAAPQWNLPVSAKDHAWAERHLPGAEPWLLISPCSSHVLRNWSAERYARVADHAINALGMRVALIGGPSRLEREVADRIHSEMSAEASDLVGQDTLQQSVAALQRAFALVTPDSGPAHIASAVGTPVIGLYAATWSRRSGPYRSLQHCVDRFAEAARQFRRSEPESLRWGTRIEEPGVMDLITVEDVIERLENLKAIS